MGKFKAIGRILKFAYNHATKRAGSLSRAGSRLLGRAGSTATRAASKLTSTTTRVVGGLAEKTPTWLRTVGVSFAGGYALDSVVKMGLSQIFHDSTSQSDCNRALVDFRAELLSQQPDNMFDVYNLAEVSGIWDNFEKGDVDPTPPAPTPVPVVPSSVPSLQEREDRACRAQGDIGSTLIYFEESMTRAIREFQVAFNSTLSLRGRTLADRESATRTLTRMLIAASRLQALVHLWMDSLSEVSGYDYGAVYRVFGASLTSLALSEREIENVHNCEHLLRAIAARNSSITSLDDKFLEFLAAVSISTSNDERTFLPLAF